MVVPQHDFIIGPFGALSSAHKGQNVTPIKHLYYTDSSVYVPHELTSEGQSIEDPEASLGAHSETILILIESYMANILLFCFFSSTHFLSLTL